MSQTTTILWTASKKGAEWNSLDPHSPTAVPHSDKLAAFHPLYNPQ